MNSPWLESAIRHLKAQGVAFEEGLSDAEIVRVEEICKCRLPPDFRQFLQLALPVSGGFPNWRSESEVVLRRLVDRPWEGIKFDIEENGLWLDDWGSRPELSSDAVADAPILIPIRSNHYLPAFPFSEDNPIFSVRQSDISIVSGTLESYLTLFPESNQEFECDHGIPFWSDVAQASRIHVPNLSAAHIGTQEEYEELRSAIEAAGYWAESNSLGAGLLKGAGVRFDRQAPSGRQRHGRFWITKRTFGWLLCTWSFYHARQSHRVTELCLTLLARLPEDADAQRGLPHWISHLDDEFRNNFDLVTFKPNTEWNDDWEARLRSFETHGWRELSRGQQDVVWESYVERFWSGDSFHTPESGTTWDISSVYLRGKDFREEMEADLAEKTLAALRECTEPGEELLALDFNHPCFYFEPHRGPSEIPHASWAIPVLPERDSYIYLAQDYRFGIIGQCVDHTICVFGQQLLDAFSSRTPLIFQKPTWSSEERCEHQNKWEQLGWQRLPIDERDERWGGFGEQFQFFERRHNPEGPRIAEPSPSLTWDIAAAFAADANAREEMIADLTRKVRTAMCKVVRPGEILYSFDALRSSERYSFSPHRLESVGREAWALPVFPDDNYSIFVTADMDCGLFGDPLDQTICVFGQEFLDAICADLPSLFGDPIRKDGHNLR